MNDYTEIQRSRIERDISSFSDPGTRVEVSGQRRRFRANWTMRGVSREAMFTVSLDHGITTKAGGRTARYDAFLAGDEMANLRNVAEMIKQSARRNFYVTTKARRTDDLGPTAVEDHPATECLADLVEEGDADATRVIMVTGEAGSGKTRVLQELVRTQADSYLRGQTDKLFLYVNAQGRALARLNEALATELQDLRVNLTYHSVATLARVGIMIPVIDGFDELLGVSGYDDAFSSLAQFLEQMEGQGCLVASARSVYYEAEFLARAGRESATGDQAWTHVPVAIAGWTDAERRELLDRFAEEEPLSDDERTVLETRVNNAFKTQEALASKPVFFAKTTELLRDVETLPNNDDLLSALTDAFLLREREQKLLDRQQEPMLSEDQLKRLMCELAEEMWNQETRELDSTSVRGVAEYVLATEELPESVRQIVTERMPTLAFLARSDKHAGIGFEHEVFFLYFLACSIIDQYLLQDTDLRVMLSRSALPALVAERLAHELHRRQRLSSPEDLQMILDRLAGAGRTEWSRGTQVRENAGLIVIELLRVCAKYGNGETVGRTIRSVTFPGGHLRDVTLRNCSLIDVSIRRTDLSSTKFIECEGREVMLVEPVIKADVCDGTLLDVEGLDTAHVYGIRVLGDDSNQTIYSPERIVQVLHSCGAPIASNGDAVKRDVPPAQLELLEGLMRAYRHTNPVCEADDNRVRIFGDRGWPDLRRLLVDHGIVTAEYRQSGGRPKLFLRRRFLPDEIMAGASKVGGADPRIVRFWDDLEAASDGRSRASA